MNGIYRSRDIELETGLKRKDLLYYRRKGVISPVGTETKGNHNLYDEDTFNKLRKVSILRKFQMNLEDIEVFIEADSHVRGEIIGEQIARLKDNLEEIEDKLLVAMFIKEKGFESMEPYMSVKGYERLVYILWKERNLK